MLGTPYYMSPEQAQGTQAVDSRSDLWSLAVIVFQAIDGRLPFESEALGDLLVKIIVAPIPVPSQFAPDLARTSTAGGRRLPRGIPAQRFQTAKEFGDSLSMCLGLSQLTDVMDRHQVRAAMAGGVPMNTPNGYGTTPQPGMPGVQHTPQPGMQHTPQPGMQHTPQPGMQQTPQPGTPMQPGMPMHMTPQPNGRTFGGSAVSTAVPRKKSNVGLFAVLGVLVVGGGAAGIAVAMGGSSSPTSAAGGTTSTAGGTAAAATTTETAATTKPTTETTAAAATTTAAAATTSAPTASDTAPAASTAASATASSVAAVEPNAGHPAQAKVPTGHAPVFSAHNEVKAATAVAPSPPPPPPPPPPVPQKSKGPDIGF